MAAGEPRQRRGHELNDRMPRPLQRDPGCSVSTGSPAFNLMCPVFVAVCSPQLVCLLCLCAGGTSPAVWVHAVVHCSLEGVVGHMLHMRLWVERWVEGGRARERFTHVVVVIMHGVCLLCV